jgi:hypothetical protein
MDLLSSKKSEIAFPVFYLTEIIMYDKQTMFAFNAKAVCA